MLFSVLVLVVFLFLAIPVLMSADLLSAFKNRILKNMERAEAEDEVRSKLYLDKLK